MQIRFGLVASFLAVAACVPAQPIVSEYNGSSVKIQTSSLAATADIKTTTQAEADRICGKTGKRAEYASTLTDPNTYVSEHLYLCL